MNTLTKRRQLAQQVAISYYEEYGTDATRSLLVDVQAAGNAKHFIEGGGLAIYYTDQRKELADIFGQTEEEADKFTDEQVWNRYIQVMSDAISRIHLTYIKQHGGRWGNIQ